VRRRLALPLVLVLLAVVATSAGGETPTPGATASALAIKISIPNQTGATTTLVEAPPESTPATGGTFQYPGDGSIVSAASTTATASTTVAANAAASAESDVSGLSLFKGLITADAVTARASAGTGVADAGGNTNGSLVQNLRIDGQPMTAAHANLGTWGQLTVAAIGVDRSAPAGAAGYRTFVTELDINLTADYGGLPAGSEIQIGYADAAAQTAPPPTSTAGTTTTIILTTVDPTAGDAPRLRVRPLGKAIPQPLLGVHPRLKSGPYVFPVYGPVSYIDTFGARRTDVSGDFHHGDDIFGELGQPVVAVTDGTIFSVGYEKVGGNRLWLLDRQGNQFYYAHLSAYSTAAVNGAQVKAGEVIGFMGNTGDAEGTPTHLHFEVHPVSTLYLGYDGAVDPTAYLKGWAHEQTLPFPIAGGWAPVLPGGKAAPEPGAILLGQSDISSANGLDPSSLQQAMKPLAAAQLLQTFVPYVPPAAPKSYPGRG
jgi:murein DD-endopeptidase MepM/ murein hydrolase activator NlpD